MNAEVPAEVKFITSALQPDPDVDRIEALTTQNLDWEQVIREAVERHKVGPLLYRNLVESGSDELVPERVVERLKQYSRQTATRNLSLTKSLLSILERLREAGIPALPYKGPALSEALYNDFSLRQSRDLDILLRPDDLLDAEAVLVECGFESKRELTKKERQLLVKHERHRTLERDGVMVELHPRISRHDPPFEVAELLERAGTADLTGDPIPAMGPVDTLFALSVHGTRHRWNQLKWICDVAYLIHEETFDWPVVLEESKRRNCYRRVLLGCGLAATVLEVELSEAVYSRLYNTGPRLIGSTYPDCLLGVDDTTSLRYRLRSRDGSINRIRYCWNKLATPYISDRADIPGPESIYLLYYIFRPVQVVFSKLTISARTLLSKFYRKN